MGKSSVTQMHALEAKKILEEVHKMIYGTHANGPWMAKQVIRSGYYWLTLEKTISTMLKNVICK